MIMGINEIVSEAGRWIEEHLKDRINTQGQVNLFETTIRVWGDLLSAYHLSSNEQGSMDRNEISLNLTGIKSDIILEAAKDLAERLLSAFTCSPTSIPFSDVVLRDCSAQPAPDGLSSTSEVSTLQLEFNYLSKLSGNPKYTTEAMKVLEHLTTLPKVEGMVPIYIRCCFLTGTLALSATKDITKKKAIEENQLTAEDMENLKLAEDLAKTCFEIAYFCMEGAFEEGPDGGNKSSEYVNDIIINQNDRHKLWHPETVESLFVLHRITDDPKYSEWGWHIFEAFERYSKVDSGAYSSLDDVTILSPPKRDNGDFLGGTLKYLYLLFGHSDVLHLDKFVFNVEAHPFPVTLST